MVFRQPEKTFETLRKDYCCQNLNIRANELKKDMLNTSRNIEKQSVFGERYDLCAHYNEFV